MYQLACKKLVFKHSDINFTITCYIRGHKCLLKLFNVSSMTHIYHYYDRRSMATKRKAAKGKAPQASESA